jgi:hypothetical protein
MKEKAKMLGDGRVISSVHSHRMISYIDLRHVWLISQTDGHILEFPQIRVDCFTQAARNRPHLIPVLDYRSELCNKLNEQKPPWETSRLGNRYEAPEAQYYLLTHAHTDHLTGLSNLHDNCTIICSEETKALLLNYERIKDRKVYDTALAAIIAEAVKGDHGEYWVRNEIKKRGLSEKKVYEGLRGREKEVGNERIWVDCIVSPVLPG